MSENELPKKSVLMSFNEEENQQSLHRLNNKQKLINLAEGQIIRISSWENLSFTESIKIGFFTTEKKRNFDVSVIVSTDPNRKIWYMLNLTYSELNWLAKNLNIPVTVNVDYNDLTIHLFQKNPELLLTFKNSTKNYSHVNFKYVWLGMTDIMIDEPVFDDWILYYT